VSETRYDELRRVIRDVRRRWRLKVALRGAAIVVATGLLAFGVSAYAMDHFRYEPWAVTSFRLFAYVALLALAARFLVLPVWGRVSDERVALYLEENEPSLQAAVLSAIERGGDAGAPERPDLSRALVARLVETAIAKCQTIDYGRPVERPGLRRASALLAAAAVLGMATAILSPAFLRHAAPFLLAPWSVGAASPYAIEVDPGNATVPRGASPTVTARLAGFQAEAVELAMRSGPATDWKRWPMTADEASSGFRFVLFDLDAGTDYFVEANGVRSSVFRIEVADLPYVKRIDLEYRFPPYTGLAPQAREETGDVVALRGTDVRVTVTPTVRVASGRLHVDGVPPQAMTVAPDGTLTASFKVAEEGFYRIELPRSDGSLQAGSPDYTIDVINDQPPSVTLLKPGRDAKVTAIEEVFTELRAEDDYGVARAELVFSVNGGPEKTLVLHQGRGRKTLSAAHTFFLEELTLEPGDFISYFARATDQGAPAQSVTTDIYFMEVRPFEREYRQAEQRGGGAAGAGGDDAALSFQQRQIIAATFKLVRDKGRAGDKQYGEDLATLALVQGRLRAQVQSLVQRISNRGVPSPGSEFEKTAQSLRSAAEAMAAARERLEGKKAKEALPPEQAALMHLQRAEAAFRDVQVSFDQAAAAGGSAMNAEDLADLFELELDKLKNQYETVERGTEERRGNRVDEALERLRELARRQEQEVERRRRFAGRLPNHGGGASGSGRDLARDTEELARQLERLARETSSPAMEETARRLQEAANAMKRSGRGDRGGAAGESEAALERLREARRGLENDRSGRVGRGVQEALRRAEAMARAQEKIAAEAEEEVARRGAGDMGQAGGQTERLLERKDALAGEVSDLEGQLDRLARDARDGKKDAARKLQEAGAAIRDGRLRDKIRYSKAVVRRGSAEQSRELEAEIGSDLSSLARKLQEAAGAAGQSDEDKRTAALERMHDLVRGLESLGERLDEGAASGGSREDGSRSDDSSKGGSPRDGSPTGAADGGPASGTPRFGPGARGSRLGLGGEEARQLRRELRERLREAEALSRELGGKGGKRDLQEAIRALRRLEEEKAYEPRALGRLIASVVEGLKSTEFALRRELEGPDKEKLFLPGGQDLPPGWQSLVVEYYRSLARKPEGR
jgi:hypothetical protein